MAMIFTSSVAPRTPHCTLLPSSSSSSSSSSPPTFLQVPTTHYRHSFALASQNTRNVIGQKCFMVKEDKEVEFSETILHSFSPLPLLYAAALLPGAGAVTSAFEPFVDVVKSFDLPGWLVHWGHPGNMIQQRIIMILLTIKNMVILLLHLKAFNLHPRTKLGCNASYAIEHHSRRFKKVLHKHTSKLLISLFSWKLLHFSHGKKNVGSCTKDWQYYWPKGS